MKNVKMRISLLRSLTCRNKENRVWLNQQLESYADEIKRTQKNNIS